MHDSVRRWAASILDPEWVKGKAVLEVGAYDVNGSLRPAIEDMGAASYCGTDNRSGPGVNIVVGAEDLASLFASPTFDLIVCTEMLEHALDWRGAVAAMKSIVRVGGRVLLTTRGPGAGRHAYPDDYWRFTQDDLRRAFGEMDILALEDDPDSPGVFLYAQRNGKKPRRPRFAVEPAPL